MATVNNTKKEKPAMLREIREQPAVWRRIIMDHIEGKSGRVIFGEFSGWQLAKLKRAGRFLFLGCGSSYHAALYGNYLFEELAEFNCEAEYADEFTVRNAVIENNTAVVALSQSGETADTARAVYLAKKQGAFIIALTNGKRSELAGMADVTIGLRTSREKAVAATKTFTAQLLLLGLLSVFISRLHKLSAGAEKVVTREIAALPEKARAVLRGDAEIGKIAAELKKAPAFAVLGEKLNWPVALEAALKLKEVAYLSAEGFAAREFRHGPLAIVKKDFPCLIFAPQDSVYGDNLALMKEVGRIGGHIIAVANEGDEAVGDVARKMIGIPKTLEMLYPLLAVIPAQLLACRLALARRIKVDSPRHLRKVTD